MTKHEFVKAIATKMDSTQKLAEKALDAIMDVIVESLAQGEEINLVGFGKFERKLIKGREGECKIPTVKGVKWKTKDSFGVKFKAGKNFIDKINE